MRWYTPFLLLVAIGLVSIPAHADWDAGQPYKWLQNPDTTPTGVDVYVSYLDEVQMGDDFLCTTTGPITDIHLWASWYHDQLPNGDPSAVTFYLSIHADIPAEQSGLGYSIPGELLWQYTFQPGTFSVRPWEEGIDEGWMNPIDDSYEFPGDHVCWQYNFFIPREEAFIQQGNEAEPMVYWLVVNVVPDDPQAWFGWKSSIDHWNDDAAWISTGPGGDGQWHDLRYPPPHELGGQSIDLAFVITTEPTDQSDFGDAPDPAYPTLRASNGAEHIIVPGLYLGSGVDGDPDGQPDATATGDDNDGNDDEDGVTFLTSPLVPGQPGNVRVDDTGGGLLDAWIDFDGNQSWMDGGDRIAGSTPLSVGANVLGFYVPPWSLPGSTVSRFRLSSQGGLPPIGSAPDGEVEDHLVQIEEGPPYKWLQEPDLRMTGIDVNASDPFVLADDFLCSETGWIDQIQIFGSWLSDVLPEGDPLSVDFYLSIHEDIPAGVDDIPYSRPGELVWEWQFPAGVFQAFPIDLAGEIEGWMDPPDGYVFPGDHQCWVYIFDLPREGRFLQWGDPDAPKVYWLDLKAYPHDAQARFGWKTSLGHWNDDAVWGEGPEPYPGPWNELVYPPDHQFQGDSIDLAFLLRGSAETPLIDFGDAPDPSYPTLLANDGARHLVGSLYLGAGIDAEPNGQPTAAADGDDNDGNDDEDGIVFTTPWVQGQTATIQVTSSGSGLLNAWADFNGNGSWADAGEQIATDWAVTAGVNTLTVAVPASAVAGTTTLRFRLSSQAGLSFTGPANDGEVEDEQVFIEAPQVFKWLQEPDLDVTGIDVNASDPFVLADDFPCTATGWIDRIHVWGSWFNDLLPAGDPMLVSFHLSIHEDIPAGVDGIPYSHPGELLWEWVAMPGQFVVNPIDLVGGAEGWMDPPDGYVFPGDQMCWEYIFDIPPEDRFAQLGTPDFPRIYWLDVKAYPEDPEARFGWKTSMIHWNDDAVWGQGPEPYFGPWEELFYPPQHEFAGQSIDLAFALHNADEPVPMDFGDAPDPSFATMLANNGARHVLGSGLFLGNGVDMDVDGQPDATATGDDNDGNDDEDGVTFLSPLGVGQTTFFDVVASGPGFLNVWIDFDLDGTWQQAADHIIIDLPLVAGLNPHIAIPTPPTATAGHSYARFRFSSYPGLGPAGPARDGEVEDYAVDIFVPTNTGEVPRQLRLYQNVPNPFNPSTVVKYDLPARSEVRIAVYDLHGSLVRTLVDGTVDAGRREVRWDGRDDSGRPVVSGIYVVQLETGAGTQSTKVTLIR